MISIQKINVLSVSVIQQLAYTIWPVTYKDILSAEQIAYMLNLLYSESALLQQFEDKHQFILVYNDNNAIGFASYSLKANSPVYKLHKIYIHPNLQGKGIGKIVIDYICTDIKTKGATSLELNVNRNNKALFFYQKNGFVIIREEDIDIGGGYFMNDYVLRLEL